MKSKHIVQLSSIILITFIFIGNLIVVSSHFTTNQHNNFIDNLLVETAQNNANVIQIVSPRSTTPRFVKQGGLFSMMIETDYFDEIYAYISTSYEPVTDEFWLDIKKTENHNNSWDITANVPLETPEELYNLTVLVKIDNALYSHTRPRAIQVLREFSDTFTVAHVADFHVGDIRGARESIEQTIGWKSIKKCIEEINLLQPDFVLISGDLVYGQLYPYEYSREYKKCYDIIQLFDVPTFLSPGNHDGYNRFREDGLEFWKTYFGSLYYSFDYGNYHFISVNSYDASPPLRRCLLFIPLNWGGYIGDEQLNWIEKDISLHKDQHKCIFLHHSPLWDTKNDSLTGQHYRNRKELLALIDHYNVDLVLSGHIHRDTVTLLNDTIYITTTTPESEIRTEDGYWGFRMIDIIEDQIVSYNYKNPKYSIPTYHLNHTIWYSGDLAMATIQNSLDIDITAFLKFIMPFGDYNVKNGDIKIIRSNNVLSEIYVSSYVEKHNEINITVEPLQ